MFIYLDIDCMYNLDILKIFQKNFMHIEIHRKSQFVGIK